MIFFWFCYYKVMNNINLIIYTLNLNLCLLLLAYSELITYIYIFLWNFFMHSAFVIDVDSWVAICLHAGLI